MMVWQSFSIDRPSGTRIHVRRAAVSSPRGVVHLVHDLAEHSGRYSDFAVFLADQGLAAIAHDHRGHGKTIAYDAPDGQFATSAGSAEIMVDIHAVQEHITGTYAGLPIILFGQGFGAAAVLNFLFGQDRRIAGAALCNMPWIEGYPGRFLRAMLRWERFRLGSDVTSPTMQRSTVHAWNRQFERPRTSFDWLSDDPATVDAYIDDPGCGFSPTIGMWLDVLRLISKASTPRLLATLLRDFPLFMMSGANDPVTNSGGHHERLFRTFQRAGFSNVKSRAYDGARHDLVNGLDHNIIRKAFVDWVDDVLGPTPSA